MSALKVSSLITTFKPTFSFTFYFAFFYTRGDSGAHTSFIPTPLFCKSIHSIIFHFNAHFIYFSSRIHNSLWRRRAYQRKNKHKQQRPSLATYHRSLLLLLCYHLAFLSVFSLLLGEESTSAYKNRSFYFLRKNISAPEILVTFFPAVINQLPSSQHWWKACLKQYSGGHIICRKVF